MHRYGTPLEDYPLHKPLHTGIEIVTNGSGIVPEYEEREAAVFALVPWAEWDNLNWHERASAVAHYRTHYSIEAHVNDAIDAERRRTERRGKK